jgi:ubiquinone/menaquinone biosynthesis C-methylase UbiE
LVDKIEILSVSLLESEKSTAADLRNLARQLKLEFGWHYLLDLTWILRQLKDVVGKTIVDAGAGTGIIQWYLANQGAKVISVDRESRAGLPGRFRQRFNVKGLRQEDLAPVNSLIGNLTGGSPSSFKKFGSELIDIFHIRTIQQPRFLGDDISGQVIIYNQDLKEMVEIQDSSIDAVVSVSSLEHNSLADMKIVVAELSRVLKPGCAIYATLGAARECDWFHEPSKGWCITESTLRAIFDISPEIKSNYDQYDRLFESLRSNEELKENLASFYFRSGNNGMPWGNWDPQYQPVGICKFKGG